MVSVGNVEYRIKDGICGEVVGRQLVVEMWSIGKMMRYVVEWMVLFGRTQNTNP